MYRKKKKEKQLSRSLLEFLLELALQYCSIIILQYCSTYSVNIYIVFTVLFVSCFYWSFTLSSHCNCKYLSWAIITRFFMESTKTWIYRLIWKSYGRFNCRLWSKFVQPKSWDIGTMIITTQKAKEKEKEKKWVYISGIFHGRRKLVNKPFFLSLGFS